MSKLNSGGRHNIGEVVNSKYCICLYEKYLSAYSAYPFFYFPFIYHLMAIILYYNSCNKKISEPKKCLYCFLGREELLCFVTFWAFKFDVASYWLYHLSVKKGEITKKPTTKDLWTFFFDKFHILSKRTLLSLLLLFGVIRQTMYLWAAIFNGINAKKFSL